MRKIISTIATIAILACVAIGAYFVMDGWYEHQYDHYHHDYDQDPY